ncbi:Aste57867_20415 [Aphanomyces stellatus]|uniref:Aste57867_20415 protein n=1 Tax=Aphanomyces stellatus TaxID=120398 RepID=A0A485LF20_9STRA|nr:hypothetical protein As57867_020349 [Aphanomyces stellatus]VFT97101.1 Aste57867_20415 [Aphanomyces stellatus]
MAFLLRFLGDILLPNEAAARKTAAARHPKDASNMPAHMRSRSRLQQQQSKQPIVQPPSSGAFDDFVDAVVDDNSDDAIVYPRHSYEPNDDDPLTPSPRRLVAGRRPKSNSHPLGHRVPSAYDGDMSEDDDTPFSRVPAPPPSSRNGGFLPKLRERTTEMSSVRKQPPPITSTRRRGSKWLFEYQSHAQTSVDSFVAKGTASEESPSMAQFAPMEPTIEEVQTPPPRSSRHRASTVPAISSSQRSPQQTRNHALNIAKDFRGRPTQLPPPPPSISANHFGRTMYDRRSSDSVVEAPPSQGRVRRLELPQSPVASSTSVDKRRPMARRLSSSEYLARYGSNEFLNVYPPQLTPRHPTRTFEEESVVSTPRHPVRRRSSMPEAQFLSRDSADDSGDEILNQIQAIRSRTDTAKLQRRTSPDLNTRLIEAAQRVPQVTLMPTTPRPKTPKTPKKVRFDCD